MGVLLFLSAFFQPHLSLCEGVLFGKPLDKYRMGAVCQGN